jgi:hypothetical protein
MQPIRDDWLYTAGLLDGEGTIRVKRCTYRRRTREHTVAVAVVNTNHSILEWLQDRFGGTITLQGGTNLPCYSWGLNGTPKAVAFLQRIRPYLRIKAKQAWLALEFVAQATWHHGKRLTPEELALRDGFYLAMQTLNHPK